MPYGERKMGKTQRPKYYTDCIQCLSNRSVPLEIVKKGNERSAQGRCKECGHQTFISVMDEETFKTIRPSLLDEIVPPLSEEEEKKAQEELKQVVFSEADVKALTGPD